MTSRASAKIGIDFNRWLAPVIAGDASLGSRLAAAAEAGFAWGCVLHGDPNLPEDADAVLAEALKAGGWSMAIERCGPDATAARIGIGLAPPPRDAAWLLATRADALDLPALAANRTIQRLARTHGVSERQIRWAFVHRRAQGRRVAFPLDDERALLDVRAAARVPLSEAELDELDALRVDAPAPRPESAA